MVARRIRVPKDNDCFYHVVAYFLGRHHQSMLETSAIRRRLAGRLATDVVHTPHDDLDHLSGTWLYEEEDIRANVALLETPESAKHQRVLREAAGAHRDVPHNILDYVVWSQLTATEVEGFEHWYQKRRDMQCLGRMLRKYTIWGDDLMAAHCVREVYARELATYVTTEAVRDTLRDDELVQVRNEVCTGAAFSPGTAVINLLQVNGEPHFDAVLFYDIEEQAAILLAYEQAEAEVQASVDRSNVAPCPYRLTKVAILHGDDDSSSFVKHVNLPRTGSWAGFTKADELDELSPRLRLALTFEAECPKDRKVSIKLVPTLGGTRDYDPEFQRLGSGPERAKNGNYGWACLDNGLIAQSSRDGFLNPDARGGTVDPTTPLEICVDGAKTVFVEGLFLPASGGIEYHVEVTDIFGTVKRSANSVRTTRTLFVQYLLGEGMDDRRDLLERVSAELPERLAPLHVNLVAVPGAFETSVPAQVEDDDDHPDGVLESRLRVAAQKAADYSPYFFNVAWIDEFVKVRRVPVEHTVFLGSLRAGQRTTWPGWEPDTRVTRPYRRITVRCRGMSFSPRDAGYEGRTWFYQPTDVELQRLCEGYEDQLADIDTRIDAAERAWIEWIEAQEGFQTQRTRVRGQLDAGHLDYTEEDLLEEWKKENRDMYKPPRVEGNDLTVTRPRAHPGAAPGRGPQRRGRRHCGGVEVGSRAKGRLACTLRTGCSGELARALGVGRRRRPGADPCGTGILKRHRASRSSATTRPACRAGPGAKSSFGPRAIARAGESDGPRSRLHYRNR
ncbi:MAG: hypothetical protein ACRBN8_40585 [Nannocystales bacterium]